MRAKLVYAALAAFGVALAACDHREPTEIINWNLNINGGIGIDTGTVNGCSWVSAITTNGQISNGRIMLSVGGKARVTMNVQSVNNCMPDQDFNWTASPPSVVNVIKIDRVTGEITGVGVGDGEVCATGVTNPAVHSCAPVTVTGTTSTLTILPVPQVSSGANCTRTFQGILSIPGTAGTWSVSGMTGVTVNGSSGAGTVPQGSAGTFTLIFTPASGAAVSTTVTVVNQDCGSGACTIVSFNPTVSSTTMVVGETRQIVPNLVTSPSGCGSVTYAENSAAITVSSTGLVTGVAPGAGDVVITPVLPSGNGAPFTLTFSVSASPAGSIVWSPSTICFSTAAGSATSQTVSLAISGVPSGTVVNLSSNNSGSVTVSPSTVSAPNGSITLTRVGTATGTVRITGSGTNVSGFVDVIVQSTACSGAGDFIDYTPPGGTGTVGSSNTTPTATCTLASGATCNQEWWYTNRPDIFNIQATDGSVTINGYNWPVGPHARINFIAPGSGLNCVQASITNKDLFRCYVWTSQ